MRQDAPAKIFALQEMVAALRTLVRYEQDIEKLTFYTREIERMLAQLRDAEAALKEQPSTANVLRFIPKKPPRSA